MRLYHIEYSRVKELENSPYKIKLIQNKGFEKLWQTLFDHVTYFPNYSLQSGNESTIFHMLKKSLQIERQS